VNDEQERNDIGCWQIALIAALLIWAGAVPLGAAALNVVLLRDQVDPGLGQVLAIGVTVLLQWPVFASTALVTRRRERWQPTAATAAIGAGIAALVTVDSTLRTLFPDLGGVSVRGEGAPAAAMALMARLLVVVLAAWLVPVLAGAPRRGLRRWLGLDRLDLPTLLLAFAVAGLITLPWPLTGALGDSLTSLTIVLQTLADIVPQILLLWGIGFVLLTGAFEKPWAGAWLTMMLAGAYAVSGTLPHGNWARLTSVFTVVTVALLLTEIRARGSGTLPVLLVSFLYTGVASLFVDPRDAIAQGIPAFQHILSQAIATIAAAVLGTVLWGARRVRTKQRERHDAEGRSGGRLAVAGAVAAIVWLVWIGLYVFAGNPGFYNDGFVIIFEEQADLGQAPSIEGRQERLQYVRQALIETAGQAQANVRAELDRRNVPYRPYYVMNMIRVDGHRWLMTTFERQPGVDRVILNPNVREYPYAIPLPYSPSTTPISGVQSNLTAIGADEAWDAGVTGEGIVVAGQDTGYDWSHPALQPHYRGWDGQQATHDYNWHDAWSASTVPFDDDSHGTHTMGTVLGDDGSGNRVGVAPDAQWIGCRNMRRGVGNPGSYAECMEFFLAPYPLGGDSFADGDISRAPHLTNNSWGCPTWEGCQAQTLQPAVEALRAAGIMMVVSAGNAGPACGTVEDPPANYDGSFSVGATTDGGTIVGFSSRGPAGDLLKPDIAAPGNNVRSSVPGGGYGYAGGTSMAGPHVAGTVALIWSANPALIGDVEATEALLCQMATSKPVERTCTMEDQVAEGPLAAVMSNPICACGGSTGVPNNVYGCGVLDAGAAVNVATEGE